MELSELFKRFEQKFMELAMRNDQLHENITDVKAEIAATKATNKALKAELAGIKKYHQQFLLSSREAVENMENIDERIKGMEKYGKKK